MRDMQTLLNQASQCHGHLCPGLVLGVRVAVRGLNELELDPERDAKRIIAYVEMDRCATDAIASVTGCSLGKRTLKFVDYGKLAATFVDLEQGRAVRVGTRETARERARGYAPPGLPDHEAQVAAYQVMPEEELLTVHRVQVVISDFDRPGRPVRRTECARCHEGINDGREVIVAGETLCRACAGQPYYVDVDDSRG